MHGVCHCVVCVPGREIMRIHACHIWFWGSRVACAVRPVVVAYAGPVSPAAALRTSVLTEDEYPLLRACILLLIILSVCTGMRHPPPPMI